MSTNIVKSGGASLSNHQQEHLRIKGESKPQDVLEPPANVGFCPEGQQKFVSMLSGASSYKLIKSQWYMLLGHQTFTGGAMSLQQTQCQLSYFEQIKQVLMSLDLPYLCVHPTPGDGNCFFHAVIDQLRRVEIFDNLPTYVKEACRDHLQLRKAIVDFLEHDMDFQTLETVKIQKKYLLQTESKKGESEISTWRRYLSQMRQSGCWAETLIILATSAFIKKEIYLVSHQQTKKHPWNKISCLIDQSTGPPLTIGYIPQQHFQSIHPSRSNSNCRGCGASFSKYMLPHLSKKKDCQVHYDMDALRKSKNSFREKAPEKMNPENNIPPSTEQCKGCKRIFKSLRHHLSKSANCQTYYDMSKLECQSKKKAELYKKAYNDKHKESIRAKQAAYDSSHRQEKQQSQARYDSRHRTEKRQSQADYDSSHRTEKQQSQAEYDSIHRSEKRQSQAKYNAGHRDEIRLKQKIYNAEHCDEIRASQAEYNKANRDIIRLKNTQRRELRFKAMGERERFLKFRKETQEGLNFPCISCHRLFFRSNTYSGVLEDLQQKLELKFPGLFENSIQVSKALSQGGKVHLCITCSKYLFNKGEMPPLSYKNGLEVDMIPDCLKLNELEQTLIAKELIFLKTFKLPVSRWSALKDRVVNVPITDNDLLQSLQTVSSLPRQPDQAGLIPVKLKRKLSYKNVVHEAYVRPQKMIEGLKFLKRAGHPSYQDIEINELYQNVICHNSFSDLNENSESSCDNSETDSSDCSTEEDSLNSNQFQRTESSMLLDDCPESNLVMNNTKKTMNKSKHSQSNVSISIAPGEGKIPTNILRSHQWDINAFPNLHPSGQFGLNYERAKKISSQQYLLQRLMNVEKRFSSNTPYLFSALYFLEREQLEKQINVSCRRGKFRDGQMLRIEDGFSIFDKIPGTPRYWQQRRYDMLARIEQLGAFQFFFTLSMADKRWEENFISFLSQQGVEISFHKNTEISDGPDIAYANGIPLTEFIRHENLHSMIQQNVITVTRNFDHRVKTFIRNIVMGRNNPMNVQYYTYRVEFQARGAAHIHGVLWLDINEIEKEFPGLIKVMNHLQRQETLSEAEKHQTVKFIDRFITCTIENDVRDIVEEVQVHHHTKTCRKYGTACRFSYPKFPSDRTLIAQPLKQSDFENEDEYKRTKKWCKDTLAKVKQQLDIILDSDIDLDSLSLSDFLDSVELQENDYYRALSVSERGLIVVLKRSMKELFVNNYNTEWLRAWNGNIDLQVCLDFFAVTTYITDYYSKDESGTTKLLQEAAKQHSNSTKENMRCLAQAYLTHREVGESEAIYRIVPSLHLSESNVKCVFVTTGFPKERSTFLRKISDGKPKGDYIVLDDYEGEFQLATSIHEKYSGRPKALKHICLAQFAIWYDTLPLKQAQKIKFDEGVSSFSDKKIVSWNKKFELPLPIHIKLSSEKLGYMRLRGFPSVLRIHKFKPSIEPHEFFYSELLLFKPWYSEDELHSDDFEDCFNLYWKMPEAEKLKTEKEKRTFVEIIKEKIFPYRNSVQEARALVELSPSHAEHIGDTIDAENEHLNLDDELTGTEENLESAVRDPGELLSAKETECHASDKSRYKRVDLSNTEEIYASARSLVPEQRIVFDIMIKYCKDLKKSIASKNQPKPKPPLLKIHGGAGAGKSKLINDIANWVEYLLRNDNDRHPDQPIILKVAPTGKAASLIKGMTLHSTFHFKFSNEYTSLGDKLRETLRKDLSKLQVVIIDEMSMVKSDLLYQLYRRLQEIKQSEDDFGGVSILLFGDLMQLQPVRANWIFECPKDPKFARSFALRSLWDLFSSIELRQNHRQGNDREYAGIMNRIRFGNQTDDDIKILKSRLNVQVPKNALHIFGTRRPVTELNTKKLNELNGTLHIIEAKTVHPTQNNFKPHISSDGFVNETPFLARLELKTGARVMLTYNTDTSDCLTNGSTGTVAGFVQNKKGSITCILVFFDDPESGAQARDKMDRDLAKKYPQSTPITIHKFDYSLGKLSKGHTAKATVFQFPLTLAWALTAHKCQGQTVKKPNCLAADMKSVFTSGQAYVILGRVQALSQLCLLSYTDNCIRVNAKAKEEAERISCNALNDIRTCWAFPPPDCLKIVTLNIRSLQRHVDDLKSDSKMLLADIICLNETFLTENSCTQPYDINGFKPFFASKGRAAGVAVFVREDFIKVKGHRSFVFEKYQIVMISFRFFDIFAVYRSPNESTNGRAVFETILSNMNRNRLTILCGDFNIPSSKGTLELSLANLGFHQLVKKPTHILGNVLDLFFTNMKSCFVVDISYHPTYYSDHDGVCVVLQKKT